MALFERKTNIKLFSEDQKENFVEKLENAHIKYKIREDKDAVYTGNITYIVSVAATDFKKVV